MSRYSPHLLRLLVVVGLVAGFAGTAHAQIPQFDALYVFGDSLVDTGNDFIATRTVGQDPAVPPSESPHRTYFEGRFSNGYIGIEYLWLALSGQAPGSAHGVKAFLSQPLLPLTPAVSFAFGGTGTPFIDSTPGGFYVPGLKGQVELYRAARPPRRKPRRPLFVIVSGVNDYRQDQFHQPLTIERSVGNIVDAVKTLYRDGARDIVVVNLPDLGQVPANAADSATATLISLAHNAALKAALDQLDAQLPGLKIVQPDLIAAFNQLPPTMNKTIPALELLFAGNPNLPPGFHMSACLFINPATCQDIPVPFNIPLNSVFWDIVHPTTEAHQILGEYLLASIAEYYTN